MPLNKIFLDKYWQQQKGESDKAFEAFRTYISLGDNRTYTTVAEKLNKSTTIINRWGSIWKWQERIRAYNNFLITEEDNRRKKEIHDRYERFGKVSDKLMQIATSKLIKMTDSDMVKLSHREIAEYLRLAIQLAGEVRDVFMPPEKEVVQVEVARQRLDLEYLKFEANNLSLQEDNNMSNLLEAMTSSVEEVWAMEQDKSEVKSEN